MIGVFPVEGRHHFFEGSFVVGDRIRGRERIGHAHRSQMLFEFRDENVAKRHRRGTDLGPDHLEAPGDRFRRRHDASIVQDGCEVAVFRQGRDDGHEVRFSGAVVADHQQTLVVHGPIELKLWKNESDQSFGHLPGDDIGLDQPPGYVGFVGFPQLDDGFDWIELDQVPVFHRVRPPASRIFIQRPQGLLSENPVRGIFCIRGGPAQRRPDRGRR